jgi:RimJ/RimL family protein N-acetyltransferase
MSDVPANAFWPLFDLRLSTGDVTLRPMNETDLMTLVERLPADVELDPTATTYAVDDDVNRGIVIHQSYWKAYGTWHPDAWRLNFAVLIEGELVGAQELEGNDFPRLRTVDTASFLVEAVRGKGVGKQMRRAVLGLAFGAMQAEAAITSAWHDNRASLGVSRALGYRPNGETLDRRGDGRDTMVHLRMLRSDWIASGASDTVTIHGFEDCRHLFGIS